MELITSSSSAVLAEGDFFLKSPSCSRRDSSSPHRAGRVGDPDAIKSASTTNEKGTLNEAISLR
ncbi:MAG: hypothetical protein IJI50_07510 [Ruminococcus sp.]|nr:hypothetical protein [Ruminococcus sp.]